MKTTIGTLFKRSFTNHIISLVRYETAYKRKANNNTVSFEQLLEDGLENKYRQNHYSEDPLTQMIVDEEFYKGYELLSELEIEAFFAVGFDGKAMKSEEDPVEKNAFNRSRRKIITYLYKERSR